MIANRLGRLPIAASVSAAVLVLAACAIQLRSGEEQSQSASSVATHFDPMAAKLEQCRTVTHEQKEALPDCRKIWAEKHRQFLGSKSGSSVPPGTGTFDTKSSELVPPKDDSRLQAGYPTAPGRD